METGHSSSFLEGVSVRMRVILSYFLQLVAVEKMWALRFLGFWSSVMRGAPAAILRLRLQGNPAAWCSDIWFLLSLIILSNFILCYLIPFYCILVSYLISSYLILFNLILSMDTSFSSSCSVGRSMDLWREWTGDVAALLFRAAILAAYKTCSASFVPGRKSTGRCLAKHWRCILVPGSGLRFGRFALEFVIGCLQMFSFCLKHLKPAHCHSSRLIVIYVIAVLMWLFLRLGQFMASYEKAQIWWSMFQSIGLDNNKNGCHKETTEPSSFFGTRSKQQLPGDRELEQQLWDSLRFLNFRPCTFADLPALWKSLSPGEGDIAVAGGTLLQAVGCSRFFFTLRILRHEKDEK